MALADHARVMPSGAAIAGAYGPGIAPASAGPFGSIALASATRVMGPEYAPDLVLDEKHCQFATDNEQCKSWPVRKDGVENPKRYCAGHLKKDNSGADAPADQGLHQGAS